MLRSRQVMIRSGQVMIRPKQLENGENPKISKRWPKCIFTKNDEIHTFFQVQKRFVVVRHNFCVTKTGGRRSLFIWPYVNVYAEYAYVLKTADIFTLELFTKSILSNFSTTLERHTVREDYIFDGSLVFFQKSWVTDILNFWELFSQFFRFFNQFRSNNPFWRASDSLKPPWNVKVDALTLIKTKHTQILEHARYFSVHHARLEFRGHQFVQVIRIIRLDLVQVEVNFEWCDFQAKYSDFQPNSWKKLEKGEWS